MSQILLDEQLNQDLALVPLLTWITAQKAEDLRPNEFVKDDRIPSLFHELKRPTLTIDVGFWNKNLVDANYCILYFALQDSQLAQIPKLLRRLLR